MSVKVLGASLALALVVPALALGAEAPPIFVGGGFIRQHALEDARGHLLVPVRGVFEAFGASVTYTPPRFVVVRKDGAVIAGLIVASTHAVVGNRPRMLAVAPIRRGGRIYVPLRAIAEIAGASVVYSANPRVVDIRLPNRTLSAPPSVVDTAAGSADSVIPSWSYGLVGIAVLGLILELCRQLAVVMRKSPRRPANVGGVPLAARPHEFPHALDPGDQHRIGQIRK
jgi:hypothetical protein